MILRIDTRPGSVSVFYRTRDGIPRWVESKTSHGDPLGILINTLELLRRAGEIW